ncbi:hypothetical protein ACFOVU_15140 [Nocardiopsis sediminis]|uniref:A-factor biosynthesis hotdog domain-containing protein n=1 Tax=Nocardiopsis sediminis TaxID=1778267 RepID=A0ABV8FMI1_9ACTN
MTLRSNDAFETVPADLADPASGLALTGWRADDGDRDRFTVEARYDSGGLLLLPAHAARQAALLIAHEAYAIPRGHHCVFRSLSCGTAPVSEAAVRASAPAPGARLAIDVECIDRDVRRGHLVGSLFRASVRSADGELGTGEVDFAFLSPAVYRFVGGSAATTAQAQPWPQSPTTEIRPDADLLLFRGRPVDHIPGMVLAEAALHLAENHIGPGRIRRFTGTFTGHAGPGEPCTVQLRSGASAGSFDVQALQAGRRVYEGSVDVDPARPEMSPK